MCINSLVCTQMYTSHSTVERINYLVGCLLGGVSEYHHRNMEKIWAKGISGQVSAKSVSAQAKILEHQETTDFVNIDSSWMAHLWWAVQPLIRATAEYLYMHYYGIWIIEPSKGLLIIRLVAPTKRNEMKIIITIIASESCFVCPLSFFLSLSLHLFSRLKILSAIGT